MASLKDVIPGGFNSAEVAPQAPQGEPLPAGVYTAEITGAELKDAKSGNGTGLKLEYTVIDGPFERRKVFQYINLRHTNSQAEQIGQSQLSSLCRAVGIGVLQDTDELFQKIVHVRVKVRPAQNGYEASNDVTGYESAGAGPVGASAPQRAAPAAPAAAGKKPWERKAA